jgi:hypothetical protein
MNRATFSLVAGYLPAAETPGMHDFPVMVINHHSPGAGRPESLRTELTRASSR